MTKLVASDDTLSLTPWLIKGYVLFCVEIVSPHFGGEAPCWLMFKPCSNSNWVDSPLLVAADRWSSVKPRKKHNLCRRWHLRKFQQTRLITYPRHNIPDKYPESKYEKDFRIINSWCFWVRGMFRGLSWNCRRWKPENIFRYLEYRGFREPYFRAILGGGESPYSRIHTSETPPL